MAKKGANFKDWKDDDLVGEIQELGNQIDGIRAERRKLRDELAKRHEARDAATRDKPAKPGDARAVGK
jgi:hypothetical protein